MATEFQLIERFLSPFRTRGPGVILGPGDDCAILRPSPGTDLCVTTDAVVEAVHFDPGFFRPQDIGHKALAVNLSDLASMGARPRWFVCSVACRSSDQPRLAGIARGMAALAERSGILLAGGNFTRADTLSLHITAAGEVPQGTALRRDRARPGDRLYVTGTLGDAALGLALGQSGKRGARLRRQLRPEPRMRAGLLARRFASAAIDISDGLLQDLGHVLDASRVGATVDALRLPLSPACRASKASLDLALGGGEDYELLLCVPPARARSFERALSAAGEKVTAIGEIVRGRRLAVLHAPPPKASGFDHFRARARR